MEAIVNSKDLEADILHKREFLFINRNWFASCNNLIGPKCIHWLYCVRIPIEFYWFRIMYRSIFTLYPLTQDSTKIKRYAALAEEEKHFQLLCSMQK